jgi:excisionase family DNA binding protein
MKDILTTTQAAERLGISARRVAALITAGKLPANQFGGSWMIRSEDLALVADRKPGRPRKADEGEKAKLLECVTTTTAKPKKAPTKTKTTKKRVSNE